MTNPTRARLFQLDSFTTERFAGNPAAVMLLERFPAAQTLQAIGAENNLSETAFLVPEGNDYRLRWFTPKVEVPLCGHATLASAAVVMERLQPGRSEVTFHSASGPLRVRKAGTGYVLNFPARPVVAAASPDRLAEALGVTPMEVLIGEFNYLVRLAGARAVRDLRPDMAALARLDRPGVIVTAEGETTAGEEGYDFVSRYFAPAKGIAEDPVTGAAHCSLAPYWSQRTGKTALRAFQASQRGGELLCRLDGDRVEIEGRCVFFFEGEATF